MIKYHAICSLYSIYEVNAERETKHCVFFDGRKVAKRHKGDGFFDTFEEAHEYIKRNLKDRTEQALSHYQSRCKDYDKFLAKYPGKEEDSDTD